MEPSCKISSCTLNKDQKRTRLNVAAWKQSQKILSNQLQINPIHLASFNINFEVLGEVLISESFALTRAPEQPAETGKAVHVIFLS